MSDAPLVNLSIKSFLDQLASDAPTPGGGAAAALTAAANARWAAHVVSACPFHTGLLTLTQSPAR